MKKFLDYLAYSILGIIVISIIGFIILWFYMEGTIYDFLIMGIVLLIIWAGLRISKD